MTSTRSPGAMRDVVGRDQRLAGRQLHLEIVDLDGPPALARCDLDHRRRAAAAAPAAIAALEAVQPLDDGAPFRELAIDV